MISDWCCFRRIVCVAWITLAAQAQVTATDLEFALPERGAPWRLQLFAGSSASAGFSTGFALTASDEVLVGITNLQGQPLAWDFLKIAGVGSSRKTGSRPTLLTRASGPDWQFIAADASTWFEGRLTGFERHAVFVEPDLFVIWDQAAANPPVKVALAVTSPGTFAFDPVRTELNGSSTRAGFTARCFSSPAGLFPRWEAGTASGPVGASRLQTVSTNAVSDLSLLTVLVPHAAGHQRSLAFKLLESDTAIGVRVHRDGLPTLICFNRKPGQAAELTGLKFSGPIAVDVFRNRKKQPNPSGRRSATAEPPAN